MRNCMIRSAALLCLFTAALFSFACTVSANDADTPVDSFESCAAAGNKILRSYPARCVTASGQVFVEPTKGGVPKLEKKSFCKDTCGDGVCAEMVCMAEGCPCAEDRTTCPQDCK